MKTLLPLIAVFCLNISVYASNTIIGSWERDVDATIQEWAKRGYFDHKTEAERKEVERILRTKLFKPMTLSITSKKYKISGEAVENKEGDYTIEKKAEDWVLISIKTEEGKLYALWHFLSPDLVHATNNMTGDLEELRSSRIVDVFVRK